MVCGACHRNILMNGTQNIKNSLTIAFNTRNLFAHLSVSFLEPTRYGNVIIYNCKHTFHEHCLPELMDLTNCGICYPIKMK